MRRVSPRALRRGSEVARRVPAHARQRRQSHRSRIRGMESLHDAEWTSVYLRNETVAKCGMTAMFLPTDRTLLL